MNFNRDAIVPLIEKHEQLIQNESDTEPIVRKTMHFLMEKLPDKVMGVFCELVIPSPVNTEIRFHNFSLHCSETMRDSCLEYLLGNSGVNNFAGGFIGTEHSIADRENMYEGLMRFIAPRSNEYRTLFDGIAGNVRKHLKPLIKKDFDTRKQIMTQMSDPEAVHEIMGHPEEWEEGKNRYVTILFTDLRGSSMFTRRESLEETCKTMKEIHQKQMRAVWANKGYCDKLMGDGMLAIFGMFTPQDHASYVKNAINGLRAAFEIIDGIKDFNEKRNLSGKSILGIGIGLHSGNVRAVLIGERNIHMSLTVFGDEVNLASRFEPATKELNHPLVISKETRNLLMGCNLVCSKGKFKTKEKEIHEGYRVKSYRDPEKDRTYDIDNLLPLVWRGEKRKKRGMLARFLT